MRMAHEHTQRRFRGWYATLLRLYPKRYRERFGAPMQQTFNDALGARAEQGKGLFGLAVWMFVETFAGCLRENWARVAVRRGSMARVALATACVLMLPALAMGFSEEVRWDLADFAVAGGLLMGAGLTYELIAGRAGNRAYRAAVGLAVAAALLLVWVTLAVGLIGRAVEPANLMFLGVLTVGALGAVIARFQAHGMAVALRATAAAQVLVGVIAVAGDLGGSGPIWSRDVLAATVIFAGLWVGSSLLFQRASASRPI